MSALSQIVFKSSDSYVIAEINESENLNVKLLGWDGIYQNSLMIFINPF